MSRAVAAQVEKAEFAVELHGAGQVGSALLRRLDEEGIPVACVHTSRGARPHAGLAARRTVFVDATPPHYDGPRAEAWVALLERTLRSGTSVVTCNKAPLAIAGARLLDAARRGGATIACSGTVGAGTPVLTTLRALSEGTGVARVEATLSGTLSFVVGRVAAGASLKEAVQEAQELGHAEPDPRLDLDGTDAWAKACILHNLLWPQERPLTLSDRRALLGLQEKEIRRLQVPAVVAILSPGSVDLRLQEGPQPGPARIQVRAFLADGSVVSLEGPGAGPTATAGALLRDLKALRAGHAQAVQHP